MNTFRTLIGPTGCRVVDGLTVIGLAFGHRLGLVVNVFSAKSSPLRRENGYTAPSISNTER
jgi:hypothetical protein